MCSERGSTQWFPSSQSSGAGQVSTSLFRICISPALQEGELPGHSRPTPMRGGLALPGLSNQHCLILQPQRKPALCSSFPQNTLGKKPDEFQLWSPSQAQPGTLLVHFPAPTFTTSPQDKALEPNTVPTSIPLSQDPNFRWSWVKCPTLPHLGGETGPQIQG